MKSQLVEAWEMGHEANLFVIDNLTPAMLKASYAPRTRTVASQFAHMHNVRLRWLKYAARDVPLTAEPFSRGAQPTKRQLKRALQASSRSVATFLERAEKAGRVASWKGSPATFLGYLVAHEAHHRGLAMVAIRIAGYPLPKEVVYGQWDWGKTSSTHRNPK